MEIADNKAAIVKCDFGFGIRVDFTAGGERADIYVAKDLIQADYDGPALRAFMEETAIAWLKQVAPQRLAGE